MPFKQLFDPEEDINSDDDLSGTVVPQEMAPLDVSDDEDQDTSDELDNENATGADAAAVQGDIKAPDQLSKYQSFINEYKKLQDQRSKGDLVNGLIAAGGKIGQSMAGKYSGNFVPDQAGNQMLAKMNERPVQDFEQRQIVQNRGITLQSEMDQHDPNSQISEAWRGYFKQKILPKNAEGKTDTTLFPNIDQYSAADLQSLLKGIGKPGQEKATQVPLVNQATGEKTTGVWHPIQQTFTDLAGKPLGSDWIRDYRAQSFIDPSTQERLGFSGGTGKTTGPLTGPGVTRPMTPAAKGNESVALDRTLLTAQQGKQLDHMRDKFLTETKNDRQAVNSADRVLKVLETGQDVGDLPAELQDQMSRAFGQTGHITDAQMGRALGRSDWKSRLKLASSMFMEGKIDDENREFLREVMTVIRDQNQNFIQNKSKVYSTNLAQDYKQSPNLKRYNVTPDSVSKLLGVESAASSTAPGGADMVMVTSKKTGKQLQLPKDKVQQALDNDLIEPLETPEE